MAKIRHYMKREMRQIKMRFYVINNNTKYKDMRNICKQNKKQWKHFFLMLNLQTNSCLNYISKWCECAKMIFDIGNLDNVVFWNGLLYQAIFLRNMCSLNNYVVLKNSLTFISNVSLNHAGISLGMRPANGRHRCIVTTSLIGWAHA